MSVAAPERPFTPPLRGARRRGVGSWLKYLVLGLLAIFVLLAVGVAVVLSSLSRGLPSITVLDDPNRGIGFKTAQIFDRQGQLLWEINDPEGGRRTVVKLQDIAPDLVKATLAAEDANFYEHQGFDRSLRPARRIST